MGEEGFLPGGEPIARRRASEESSNLGFYEGLKGGPAARPIARSLCDIFLLRFSLFYLNIKWR